MPLVFRLVDREPAHQRGAQQVDVHRLDQIGVHAGREAALLLALHGVRRHGDHRRARLIVVPLGFDRAQAARELVAVHARHVDVGEHRRVGPRLPGFERLDAVLGGVGRDAEQIELAHQHFLVHRMIVDHEHQRALAARAISAARAAPRSRSNAARPR